MKETRVVLMKMQSGSVKNHLAYVLYWFLPVLSPLDADQPW